MRQHGKYGWRSSRHAKAVPDLVSLVSRDRSVVRLWHAVFRP
jgi:hypothetical protein